MSLKVDIRRRLGSFDLAVAFAAEQECLALLGASGSGKSVTLQCIAGILKPDEGHIEMDGRVLYDSAAGICLPPQQRQVGYLFQQYALFPHMTVRQNIAVAVRQHDRRKDVTEELLRRFQLTDAADRRPARISGGQQQRAALARILASEPKAILLDEPFAALDSYLQYQLELELQNTLAAFPGTVLWVTHDRGEAWRSCRRVCVLEEGRSQPVTEMTELFRAPATESAARLSGCKNYAAARPAGQRVELPEWGLTLETGRAVPPDTVTAGIRSHHVTFAVPGAANAFSCRVVRIIDDVFETIVLLRPEGAAEDAPLLRMECAKEAWRAREKLPVQTVAVAPEHILLLK